MAKERMLGIDPDFRSAFPEGPPLLPKEVALEILRDPKAYAEKLAKKIQKKVEESQKAATKNQEK